MTDTGSIELPALPRSIRRTNVPLGIFYMLCATVVFATSNAGAKWLVADYPFGEVLFARQFASLVICALFVLPFSGVAVFRTRRLRAHGIRAAAQGTSQSLMMIALMLLPLGSAVAINFSAPVFATLASALFLREKVGPTRWTALIAGLIGVVIITSPGAATFQVGSLFAVANAILYGSVTAGVRGMTATESADTLIMYQMVLLTVLYTFYLPFGVAVPTLRDGGIMLAMGFGNGFGQYLWTRALHLAPASAVTPFYYFSLVWALFLGFLIWGDVPTAGLLAGSAIVVGSGLFLLWRETAAKR